MVLPSSLSSLQKAAGCLHAIQRIGVGGSVIGFTALVARTLFRPPSLATGIPTLLNMTQMLTCVATCGLAIRGVRWFRQSPPSPEKEALRVQSGDRIIYLAAPLLLAGLNQYLQPLPFMMPALITAVGVAYLEG